MKIEGDWVFWVFGALAVCLVWLYCNTLSSMRLRFHIRAITLSLGLGVAFIPGAAYHSIMPSTQLLWDISTNDEYASAMLWIGASYWLVNWVVALIVLSFWRRTEKPLSQTNTNAGGPAEA